MTSRHLFLAALAALCAWHLVLRRHGLALPLMADEGEYACAARAWAEGGLPYQDSSSQKPPMVFLLYRIAYAAQPQAPLAPRKLAIIWSLCAMVLLWRLTPEDWDPAARLTAPAVFAVLSTTPIGNFGFSADTEVFLCTFVAAAAWALEKARRRSRPGWLFLAGLCAGAAFMTKQTAAWTVTAFCVLAAWRGGATGWKRNCGLFAAGAAILPVFWACYFWHRGALGPFWEQVFRRNMAYAGVVWETGIAGSQLRWFFTTVAPLFLAGDWPVYATALFSLMRRRPGAESPETLATLWLSAALLGAVTGWFLFPYYFLPVVPPLALAAAAGAQQAARYWPRWRPAVWLLAVFCLYPAAVRNRAYFRDPPAALARRLLYPNPMQESIIISDYIREHSRPDEPLYIFGYEAQIYVYSHRKPAGNVFSYSLTLFPRHREDIEAELARIAAARPRFILYSNQPASTLIASALGAEFRDEVRKLIRRYYRWAGQVRIGPTGTLSRFGSDQVGPGEPDWTDEYSLFLFERKS